MRVKGQKIMVAVFLSELFFMFANGDVGFELDAYTVVIDEHPSPGTEIDMLAAVDTNSPANIAFSIGDVNFLGGVVVLANRTSVRNVFTIRLFVGPNVTNSTFDYEERQRVVILIDATNNIGELATVPVNIQLRDINDNAPMFPLAIRVNVSENTAVGEIVATLEATDRDSGFNALITYGHVTQSNVFMVHDDGVVTLLQQLDYETQRQYQITVNATDLGMPRMSSTGEVSIMVTDFNDQNPVFESLLYEVEVFENLTVGSEILQVSAYDGDRGINDTILYAISGGSDAFMIDVSTGLILLNSSLDRENISVYNLRVTAEEMMDHTRRNITDVTIMILDINDNFPIFVNEQYNISINETTPAGSNVLTVVAEDSDEAEHARTRYYINPLNQPLPFSIANATTGEIVVDVRLDYEKQQMYSFEVFADDLSDAVGSGAAVSTTTVYINVINRNDEYPQFNNAPYNFSLLEHCDSSNFVAMLNVTDRDIGPGGVVMVNITSHQDIFELVEDQLVVKNCSLFDYEMSSRYEINVVATDLGTPPLTSTERVTVYLINENDNIPTISCTSLLVMEGIDVEGFPLTTINASDADGDQLHFTIDEYLSCPAGIKQYFSFSGDQLVTTSEQIDYENFTEILLSINVTDGNHSSNCLLRINVTDINDNVPVFTNNPRSFNVSEDVEIRKKIGTINVTDDDTGQFAVVAFSVNDSRVSINSTSGELYLSQLLDYEIERSFFFEVMVSDNPGGEQVNTISASFTISVEDVNDNAPVFTESLYMEILAEMVSEFSLTVTANDRDTGTNAEIFYVIESSNVDYSELLQLNRDTGVISKIPSGTFDRELFENISLTVVAFDNGSPQLNGTAQVLIILLDVNDNGPSFINSIYNFSVFENVNVGHIVGTVSAFDPDEGANADVTYSLGSLVIAPFRLDETNPGNIVVDELLDRENKDCFTIHVDVSDGVNNSTSTLVKIFVLDVNDNPPQFTATSYREVLPEDVTVGTTIANVTATDNDMAPYNMICYSILAEDRETTPTGFIINNRSGEITIGSELDFDENEFVPTILMYVYATDNPDCETNGNYFVTFVSFLVTVVDVNDNRPQFTASNGSVLNNDSFELFLFEGSSGQVDTNITVTDIDSEDFGRVMLTTNSTDFRVSLSGRQSLLLVVLTELDRESTAQYNILINATDGGGATSIAYMIINVLDINEQPPAFNASGYVTHIIEGDYIDEVIYTGILAEDLETGGDAVLKYRLQDQQNELFSINEMTGIVTVSGTIDRETNESFILTVVAYEEATPSLFLSSTAMLTIVVVDVNDNPPVILSCSNDMVPETDVVGSAILTVVASDDDVGALIYQIEDYSNTFTINSTTGVVSTNSLLDYEGVRQYNFTVTVSDTMFNTTEYCSIMLVDVNDNAPQFVSGCCINISISELTAVGTILQIDLNTTDNDSGPNGQVMLISLFQFVGKFDLLDNNSIVVTNELDYEVSSEYLLIIQAKDMAISEVDRLTSNITIVVQLINENDNDPAFNSSMYEFSMAESSPYGTFVGQVFASDADGDPLTITVVNGLSVSFTVNNSGLVSSNENSSFFDYDVPPVCYYFTIEASDGDRTDTASIVVCLTDINDNSPLFRQSYNTTLAAGSYSNQPFLAVMASDLDSFDNGRITYIILSNPEGRFRLNTDTGLLSVNGLFNTNVTYVLQVLAMDHGIPSRNHTATVTVNVMDLNMGDLRFVNASYNANVMENTPIDYEIIMLSVETGAIPSYFLATNIPQFVVNLTSGVLSTAVSLDYENDAHMYIFTVLARSQTDSVALATVTINLLDVNDNGPLFVDSNGTQVSIAENSPINTTIYTLSTVDADSSANSNTAYRIMSSNLSSLFAVTGLGQLVLTGSLDRELAPFYHLTVMAYDVDMPLLNDTIDVTVIVLDSNDHYPLFTQPYYNASINEAASNGTKVVTIMATDRDEGRNGDVFFTIIDGDDGGHFTVGSIKSCEGTVYTSDIPTDRELQSSINLTIQASDKGSPPRTNTTVVTVMLLDINDNAPVLTTTGPFAVMENISIGVILTLSASDADLPENGYNTISYFLNEDFDGLFLLNVTTAELMITNSLDRENIDSYNLILILQDVPTDGSRVNNNSSMITIDVTDVNDNDPQFSPITMPIMVSEMNSQGMVVITLTATDIDEGSNADIVISVVSIVPNDPFEAFGIEPVGLVGIANLTVNNELNRESTSFYNITVRAADMGNPVRSSEMMFNISVIDANDNAPILNMSRYAFRISEGASIGSLVGTLFAVDMDENILTYEYASGDTPDFTIDPRSGAINVAASLDRETNPSYHFIAQVRDGVNDPSVADVNITLLDVNDNAPEFNLPQYSGCIEEGSLPSVSVTINPRILAVDIDEAGPNSQVTYSLLNDEGVEFFRIDRSTAIVEVSLEGYNNLDYETVSQFNLRVHAKDSGTPALTSIARLLIVVKDVNDNAPIFTEEQYQISVTETDVNGTLSLPVTVLATDVDSDEVNGGGVSYSISAGNTGLFALNNETGQLFAIQQIDAEESTVYNLTVVAVDRKPPFNSGSASVLIIVNDINDNAPQFNASQFVASISETIGGELTTEQQYVTTLGISDPDRGVNNNMLSIIVHSDKFTINQHDHHLYTKVNSSLDRETSAVEHFIVTACDHGVPQLCSNATVIVTLSDVNDNDPLFDQLNVTLTIRRSELVGSTLAVFVAQDQDIGVNGEIRYSLNYNITEPLFRVDHSVGSLIVNQPIGDQFINDSVELVITAEDQGSPSRSGSVLVTVVIVGDIGAIPVFNQSLYNVSVFEDRPAGQHVVTVSASSTATADIQYFIDVPPVGFTIDNVQGIITTTESLNRENDTSYSFSVRASNGIASAFSLVVVTVIDANDHSPQFENLPYTFSILENNEFGEFVGQLVATDEDVGSNAELQYTIVAGNNTFSIDQQNGSLYANQSLDREEVSSHIITVTVTDMGTPPRNTTTNVTITVLDENDNTPRIENIDTFDNPLVALGNATSVVIIPESQSTYTPILKLMVNDVDEGNNGDFVYMLSEDSSNPFFVIDRFLGELESRRELDYESINNFNLTIIVVDRGQPSLNISHNVVVNISDVNDCVPDFGFSSSSLFTSLDEELSVGTPVMSFIAMDCDSSNNGLVEYSITSGDQYEHFTINNTTGHLVTNVVLDRENISEYLLVITAADHGQPSLNSSVELTVLLNDVNDNAPQFQFLPRNVTVSESIPLSSIVTTISAVDSDTSSTVSYQIGSHVFSISQIGVVTLSETLDREMISRYNITITATDGLNSNVAQLLVVVEDVNDNSPVFSNTSCQVPIFLREDVNEDTTVCNVSATDADEGNNGRILYSFLNTQELFAIDRTTGRISTQGSFDHELQSIYNLGVQAQDQADVLSQRRVTVYTVFVEVVDLNDNTPQFTQDVYYGTVIENSSAVFDILSVSATDQDATSLNNEVQYTLRAGNGSDRFVIDFSSGVIRNRIKLDREDISVYNITVVGSNTDAIPALSATATAVITVQDVNEFPPVFVSPPSRVNVSEYPTNESILQLQSDDMDDNPGAVFSYFILTRIPNSPFSLGSSDGHLVLTGTLDYEQRQDYNLMFQVSDGDKSSNASIIIEVIDENDNKPYFSNVDVDGFIRASVVEEQDAAYVTMLSFIDADSNENYINSTMHLISATGMTTNLDASDYFDLDSLTGNLTVSMPVDREENEVFVLNVTVNNTSPGVYCSVNSSMCNLFSFAQVLVTVLDVNDNSPVFFNKTYNSDITTTHGIGQRVLQVKATDDDQLFGPIIYDLNMEVGNTRFDIDEESGEIVTVASFLNNAGEQFTFTVIAKDNGGVGVYNSGEATFTVIVLDNLQRVVIVFGCSKSLIEPLADNITRSLENITGYEIRLETVEPHYQRDKVTGEKLTSNDSFTDVVFYATRRSDNKIVEGEEVLSVLDINLLEEMLGITDTCKIQLAQPVQELLIASKEDLTSLQVVLIILAGLIGSGGLLMLCLSYRQRYIGTHLKQERYMADIFYGPSDNIEDIERRKITTETFEMVGEPITQSKPMEVQPYQDWSQPANVEMRPNTTKRTLKRDNPLYESQEIHMEMFADMSETDFSEEDEAGLLAAAIADDDEEDPDELVTAI